MARTTKTLEEQLKEAQNNLETAKELVEKYKKKISDINKKIDDRDMRRALVLMRQNGVSIEQFETMIVKKNTKK